jgi:hypothetical protein
MKRGATIFLQVVIAAFGLITLLLLLWEPHTEGVNANATFFEVYLDPFIMLVYIGSIPFFIGLFQAFKILGYVGQNNAFTPAAVRAFRKIKYCAMAIICFVVAEEIFIMLTHGNDDATGAFVMGMGITFGSIIVATAAAVFENIVQKAVDLQSESDLTV